MTAPRLALLTALTFAPLPALGQGFSHPPGLSPSVTPAMIGPGSFGPRFPVYSPFARPGAFNYAYGGYGGYGYGGYGYYPALFGDYGYPGLGLYTAPAPALPPVAPPLQGTAPTATDPAAPTVDMTAPGEVTFEFPADVALTVDGVAVPGGGRERTVISKPLRPGEEVRLTVRATWTAGGERTEWDRVVTVGRGAHSRVTVARGFAAK